MSDLVEETAARTYLQRAREEGKLGVVAARLNLPEGRLRDFSNGDSALTDVEILYVATKLEMLK